MNNNGVIHFVGFGGLILLVLLIFGIIGFLGEDLPAISDELKKEVCIPIQKENSICFLNESGIRLIGQFENYVFEINSNGDKRICYIDSKKYSFEQACVNEFGYLYQKNDFILNILVKGNVIKVIPKYEIYDVFWRLIKNPNINKRLIKDAPEAFIIRGLFYLAEHPELFNQTSNNLSDYNETKNKIQTN